LTIRIAHLSDIHFGGEAPEAVEAATAAVATFAPTLTVVSGDLTLNGLPREFRAAAAWLKRLPAARMVTPGNHDTPYWNLVLRALDPFGRYRRYIGRAGDAAFDASGLTARALNSARGAQPRPNWSKGAIDLDDLRRIDWDAPSGAVKLFACHHPLIDLADAPVTGGVHCGAEAAEILAGAGVELILTGHVHNPFALALPTSGAGPACYALGAGTLSLRTRGTPPSFSTIVAEAAAFTVTALGWTGGRFEPIETWTLPRSGDTTLACN
jgi:3',5'-cyclic AMP phosphodiesterase CpdA